MALAIFAKGEAFCGRIVNFIERTAGYENEYVHEHLLTP